jgi:hypothetical protein
MGTYIEEIGFPLGEQEARNRIEKWRTRDGKDFKLEKKGPNWLHIKYKTMHFVITLQPNSIRFEAWVGGITKYSIDSKATVGAIARREGWNVYMTLRNILTEGIELGSII